MSEKNIFLLSGVVRNYSWGGTTFIPRLLQLENKSNEPFAEYWMGAHPSAPSTLDMNHQKNALNQLIEQDAARYIGSEVFEKFGELPYLFKVLDVKEMLSIQVHPSKSEAEKGFDKEEAEGKSISDPTRNYKDRNHKPEVMVALSDFYLLHGFKNEALLRQTLLDTAELTPLLAEFDRSGYKGLYQYVMELPQEEVDNFLEPLVKSALATEPAKTAPAYWVKKLYPNGISESEALTNIDRGIFSIYFFNIVYVKPGQAVFQGAGVPHAYLEGQNVELMANSDNVLRGGLTPKHIDVPELLKHTTFEGIEPNIMDGDQLDDATWNYPCPVGDFGIQKINLTEGAATEGHSKSGEIILVMDGDINISDNADPGSQNDLHLFRGEACYILPGTQYRVSSDESGQAYKAFVPLA
ncbi:mannose-6-phosphate isomerase, type 1 [Arachidicoccus rhizosphaerae]|jgi:mannose-6-phosphate isomerase|uniref:mannose-6-phosphate isomerase n=1 Tax=Arachidicoccus rhizosphaerae TaxID=551991 RepID=A0A1H4BPW0_9BACT|nr:mannose-6-phosphate isomerase, class I [Arachidicoccus rhizosphaerae]SEA50148.1 mannose-6-phosphate isomerase, type 1 [Arachidicoccus rhizosphaerae]